MLDIYWAYLVDVFALKLREQLLQALIVRLDADRAKDFLDIFGGRGAIASEAEEQVCCKMLHGDGFYRQKSAIVN